MDVVEGAVEGILVKLVRYGCFRISTSLPAKWEEYGGCRRTIPIFEIVLTAARVGGHDGFNKRQSGGRSAAV
jgi:hypothetical protein